MSKYFIEMEQTVVTYLNESKDNNAEASTKPYIDHFFQVSKDTEMHIRSLKPEFGSALGEVVYMRTYSRIKSDGTQERWHDTVLRVINGTFSILKDHMIKHHLHWSDDQWQNYARDFGISLFKMQWLAPGRGLWISNTDVCKNKGSMALYNCGCATMKDFKVGATWVMDGLMCGTGCGFDTEWDGDAIK